MTRAEFNRWWTHFATAFPAARDFVCKDGRQGVEALGLWFGVLEKRDIADALAVTNGLFEGVLQAIPGTERGFPDWSQVPRHVSRLCAERHAIEPEWKQHTRERVKPGIIEGDKSMRDALTKCLEIMERFPPRSREAKAAVSNFLDEYYPGTGGKSPAAARDRGNYESSFDEWNGA